MTNLSLKSLLQPLAVAAFLAVLAPASNAFAGTLQARIVSPIDNANRTALSGSRSPLADPANDLGVVSPSMQLHGISLIFSRTPSQQAALTALIAAQQNPATSQYHQWLTPDQFAAQFGVSDSDIAATEAWLQQQGFSIDSVSRSRNCIFFSGTAAQVATAFGAPLHNFKTPSGTQYAPANDLTLPAALGPNVQAIGNLSSFRPQSRLRLRTAAQPVAGAADAAQPNFTSSISGAHFVTPADLVTIYDVKPAYNAGYTGVNQSIAIIGQTFIALSDVASFQSAAGVTAKTPILALVPNSGSSYISSSDEPEADLDVEYSSTMAYGAQVYFIYTGNSTNYNVFNSLQYAVDERVSPIISSSYGACEPALGASNVAQLDLILSQAAAQGQTVLSAAGDDGATDCQADYTAGTTSAYQLAVDYPGSSPYVTSMGGSEFPTAYTAVGNTTYWAAQGATDVVSSAKSYIPEQVWNDDIVNGNTSSGGGGASIYESRPTWQTAGTVIGGVALPAGSFRLVPDISLDASNYSAPLAYCTSESAAYVAGQSSSCTSGFRDSASGDLTLGGGTSFDGPIFAGMLALINQSLNSTGQGVINPTLYTLAANSSTYATAFHDITAGGNQCLAPYTICGSTGAQLTSFAAATGYDEASGLGSIDLYNLLNAWPKSATSSLTQTITNLTASTSTPNLNTADTVTIAVTQNNLTTPAISIPTGSVTLLIDGGTANGGTTTTLQLTSGVATYSFSSTVSGSHFITATYSGDTVNGTSTGTIYLNVAPTIGTGSFTLTSTSPVITAGSSAPITFTITSASGYTGNVDLSLFGGTTSSGTMIANTCISGSGVVPVTTAGGTATYTVYTSAAACSAQGLTPFLRSGHFAQATSRLPQRPWRSLPAVPVATFALLLAGLSFKRRSRLLRGLVGFGMVIILSLSGLGLAGCSNGSNAAVVNPVAPAAVYNFTLTGTDSNNPTLTSTTTFTITIQ